MSDVVDLARRRVEKAGDCRAWTVADCLRDALQMIEEGEIDPDMVFIALRSKPDDNGLVGYPHFAAGVTKLEALGLLARHLAQENVDG